MRCKNSTNFHLVESLIAIGVDEQEVIVRNKLSRGKFHGGVSSTMFKHNRFAYGAIGLVVGLGLAMLFLLWAVPGFRSPANNQIGQQHTDIGTGGNEKPAQPPSFWKTYTTPSDTYAQWIAALSALLSVGISIWAVRLVRDTLELNRSATSAAIEAVRVSREIGFAQSRAFVFCDHVESAWVARKGEENILEWFFFPVWRNTGNTPIKNAISKVNAWVGTDVGPLPKDFDYPDYNGPPAKIVIGPQGTMHGLHLPIPIETMVKIREKTAHAYIWGWIEYSDIFPDTPRHRSEFCLEIEVIANPIHKEFQPRYANIGPFNGTDEDCYRQPDQKG
ncbi:MAG: hypothetical protein ABIQ51_16345 [Mesorhizobium sp.]